MCWAIIACARAHPAQALRASDEPSARDCALEAMRAQGFSLGDNVPARGHAGISARDEGWHALCVYLAYTSEHNLNTFEHGFFRALNKDGM